MQDLKCEALSSQNVVSQKSPKKHYKLKFNQDWINKNNKEYRDWIQPTSDPEKFYDKACDETYQCDYLHKHEKKKFIMTSTMNGKRPLPLTKL